MAAVFLKILNMSITAGWLSASYCILVSSALLDFLYAVLQGYRACLR